jgi:hypothetical protein
LTARNKWTFTLPTVHEFPRRYPARESLQNGAYITLPLHGDNAPACRSGILFPGAHLGARVDRGRRSTGAPRLIEDILFLLFLVPAFLRAVVKGPGLVAMRNTRTKTPVGSTSLFFIVLINASCGTPTRFRFPSPVRRRVDAALKTPLNLIKRHVIPLSAAWQVPYPHRG